VVFPELARLLVCSPRSGTQKSDATLDQRVASMSSMIAPYL
jgi:hypothetical protein